MDSTFIGIDLGTSSVKLLLVSKSGNILASVSKEYPIFYPQSGFSEQNPNDWYMQVISGIKDLLIGQDSRAVEGISFGGQMHGAVLLDVNDNVIRPAILWNDGRTQKQTDYLNKIVGKEKLSKFTANIAFAGFTAPKIMWIKENEPQNFAKINKIMLPKDYLLYRLSGKHCTDYSDASGTLLLDIKNKKWSSEMCDICSVNEKWLPKLHESYESIGNILPSLAKELELNPNIIIATGAGDNAAAAVGTGTVESGSCNISLGTSGTVFICSDKFSVDSKNALHSFCHASGAYHLMGCILSAASCNKWWMEEILKTKDFSLEQQEIEQFCGDNDIFFLPYLMGERSPHNDVNARGAFVGMRPDTSRKQMTLAVMEGVAFALKDCLEIAKSNGVDISSAKICGGGAKSVLWRQIIADVLFMPIDILEIEEGTAYGAAILAMVASGKYVNVKEACSRLIKIKETIVYNKLRSENYQKKYEIFKKLYPALKEVFKEISF